MTQYRDSLHNCSRCKNKWINSISDSGEFGKWNRIMVEDCLTFPVDQKWFQVLRLCWAATNACHLTIGIHLGYRKTFFGNQFSTRGSSRNASQGIHHCETRRETASVPRAIGTGTSFARDDEKNKGTIPMPMFARRLSTMSSSILVEIPQNPMVGQQRQQISELQFDKLTTPQSFFNVGR